MALAGSADHSEQCAPGDSLAPGTNMAHILVIHKIFGGYMCHGHQHRAWLQQSHESRLVLQWQLTLEANIALDGSTGCSD